MAISLLNLADDEGYFYSDPSAIRAFSRPFDDDSKMTLGCLQRLIEIGYLQIRQHDVRGLIGFVVGFDEHQRVDKPKASKIKKFFNEAIPMIVLGIVQDESKTIPAGKEGKGTEGKEELKPSRRVAPCDPRFSECVDILDRYCKKFVHKLPFGIWFGNRGGKQLKSLLKAEPQLDVATFERAVGARARSPGIDHEEPVYKWVFHVIGSNRGNGNGQIRSVSKADERERRIVEQAQKYADYRPGSAVDSESQSTLALPGNGRDGVRGLAGDPELIPPKRDSDGTRPPHAAAAKA